MSFTEQTAAEAGFATHWDRFIGPGLAYHKRYYRRFVALEIIVALLGCVVTFGGGFVVLTWGSQTDNLWLSLAIIAVLAFGAYGITHMAGRPHRRLTTMASQQLQQALAAHFAGWIKPTDDAKAMYRFAKYLQKQRITTSGTVQIGTAYDSIASDPAFRFYNCSYSVSRGKSATTETTTYLVVHIRMCQAIPSPIRILVDRGFGNVVSKIMARRNNVPFSNADFERRYEVFADDEDLARTIISDKFQQAMIDLHTYFSADMAWFQDTSDISCIIEGDEFVLCLSNIDDVDGSKTAKGSTKQLEKAAHLAIAEIGQIPYIVKAIQMAAPDLFRSQ